MKGIKECLYWMLDNPMKEIEAIGFENWRWNNEIDSFQYKTDSGWISAIYFDDLNAAEWEEVKTPYNVIEAFDLCKNEKKIFKSNYGIMEQDPITGKVFVECFGGGEFGKVIYLETEWYEY